MSSFEYIQYVPQQNMVLDATTGQFIDPSTYVDSQGNLVPPEGYSFITGVVLSDAMPFPQPVAPAPMINVPLVPFTNVPSYYYPMNTLPNSFTLSPMMQPMAVQQPMQMPTQHLTMPPPQMNFSSQSREISAENLMYTQPPMRSSQENLPDHKVSAPPNSNRRHSGQILEQQNAVQPNVVQKERVHAKGFGEKQKAIPQVFEYIKSKFLEKNKFVVDRTIDGVGATFRVCAKSIDSLLALPRLILHIDQEIEILEVSLHVMMRRQSYRKGITTYIKIAKKDDINRALDIGDLHGQQMTIVSKGDKDTREPGIEIQIMYKSDSKPEDLKLLQNVKATGDDDEDLGLSAMPMMKKKSSILTIILPETGHIVNLNIEGIEQDESDDEEGLCVPVLDHHSSLTLQQTVLQSLSSSEKRREEEESEANINTSEEETSIENVQNSISSLKLAGEN